jgi:hypothetical protein
MSAALAAAVAVPASAAPAPSANVFRTGAYYRALLLSPGRPAYWAGGTVWVPLVPARPRVAQPTAVGGAVAQWRRVPDAYIGAALASPPEGPLWVKTDTGFRLEAGPKP